MEPATQSELVKCLPRKYLHEIVSFNKLENGYSSVIRSSVKTRDEVKEWLEDFEANTTSNWIFYHSKKRKTSDYVMYCCKFSSTNKKLPPEHRKARNMECRATISFSLRAKIHKKAKITINSVHPHGYNAKVLSKRPVSQTVVVKI